MVNRFEKLLAYTQASQEKYGASALIIIQDGQTVTEWYAGHHHLLELVHSEWVSVPHANLVCDFQAAELPAVIV